MPTYRIKTKLTLQRSLSYIHKWSNFQVDITKVHNEKYQYSLLKIVMEFLTVMKKK